MRLSFILLVAAAATLLASGNALSENTPSVSTRTSSKKVQVAAAAGQTDGKRFLRKRHVVDEVDDEERGVITAPTRSKMLSSNAYKDEVFANWLKHNQSSFTIRDYLKLETKWKQKYQNLYNEYASVRKAAGMYP